MYCNLKHGVTLHLQFVTGITTYFEKLNIRLLQAEKCLLLNPLLPLSQPCYLLQTAVMGSDKRRRASLVSLALAYGLKLRGCCTLSHVFLLAIGYLKWLAKAPVANLSRNGTMAANSSCSFQFWSTKSLKPTLIMQDFAGKALSITTIMNLRGIASMRKHAFGRVRG